MLVITRLAIFSLFFVISMHSGIAVSRTRPLNLLLIYRHFFY